jgi:hypothetical protein
MTDVGSMQQFTLPSPSVVFALIVFGVIGSVAFLYGMKRRKPRALGLGLALCVFPYFTDSALLIWLGSLVLTAALFLWRDD